MRYIDMHCDTLSEAVAKKCGTVYELPGTMLDLKRLREAGAGAQFFAMFLPQRQEPGWFGLDAMPGLSELMEMMHRVYRETMERYSDIVAPARSLADYRANLAAGKISAFLTVENGALADGEMENLKKLKDMGVGLMTLTWNDRNCFGTNHSDDPKQMQEGLTDFGKEAVGYMNELGIVVDVSHLSDGGFYDVAECCTKPFVASHSNCRALCSSTRNLTDDMIRVLAEKGGVCGVNFAPGFVNPDPADQYTTAAALCDHVEHLRQVGGEDCVGIGTDFDGIRGDFEIADCTCMHLLFEELQRRGHGSRFLEKFAFGNVERVIGDAMG